MSPVLAIRAVSKRFGGRRVLDRLDVVFDGPGTLVVGGTNGSGKSTLLATIGGVIVPDAGDVEVGGSSIRTERARALRNVGYVPETAEYPGHLTVRELLDLIATLKDAPRAEPDLVERFGAGALLRQRFATLSLGQRQRVCLTAALLGDPLLLVLDEPSIGLDADALSRLERLLSEREGAGRATVLATHDPARAAGTARARIELRPALG